VELGLRAARGAEVPPLTWIDIALVTSANLLDATLDAVYMLPNVLANAIERGDALERARDEIIQARDQIIQAQAVALRELSSPLIPISDNVLVMPLIGAIDSGRAQQVLETLLAGIASHAAHLVIVDITGVPLIDTQMANALIRTAQAVKLLGAQVVLTGIRPEVAQTLVGLDLDLRGIVTCSTLQAGIVYGLRRR